MYDMPEEIDVRAPLDFEHASSIDPRRQDVHRGRDKQVHVPRDAVPPSAHRFDEQRPIEPVLWRARVIHDRGIHFEDGRTPKPRGREHALTAEVVVALHDDVGLDAPREIGDCARPHPAQFLPAKWRAHGVPAHGARRPAVAGLGRHVNLMAARGQPFRN